MKYIANPVEVEAFKIAVIGDVSESGGRELQLDSIETVMATSEMLARMTPTVGDYLVIQSDGYVYLNPKDVFERKYSYDPPCGETLLGNDTHPTLTCGERKSKHTPEAARGDVGMDHQFVPATFD